MIPFAVIGARPKSSTQTRVWSCTARAIAASPRFKAIVKCNHKSPTKAISAAVNEHLGLRISDRTLQRARNLVVGNIHGGLLPVLFCDGAHTKTHVCKRFLLIISALNAERQLVILAVACVKNDSMWSLADYERAFGSLEVHAPSAAEEFACSNQIDFPRRMLIPAQDAQRGRPNKKRSKSFDERIRAQKRAAGTSSVMCGICGVSGHNMRSCNIIHRPCMEED